MTFETEYGSLDVGLVAGHAGGEPSAWSSPHNQSGKSVRSVNRAGSDCFSNSREPGLKCKRPGTMLGRMEVTKTNV